MDSGVMTANISDEVKVEAINWLAEQIPGGFFIYSAHEPLEILYINKPAINMFGCKTVEEFRQLTGNTFDGMVHPEDYAGIQASIDS